MSDFDGSDGLELYPKSAQSDLRTRIAAAIAAQHVSEYPLCGTEAGAKVHERRGEKRCPACTRAVNVAKTNRASA